MVATVAGPTVDWSRTGEGYWNAGFQMGVYVVVRGDTYENTADSVSVLTRAASMVALQHTIDVPGAKRALFASEVPRERDTQAERSLGIGAVTFIVPVKEVMNDRTGPTVPPAEPYAKEDWPQVVTHDISVDRKP
jgi:hypothetical protein